MSVPTVLTRTPSDERANRMRELLEQHRGPVYRFLLGLSYGDRHTAEDLTQETFLRAWRTIDSLHTDISTVRPWLFTVARRVAIDAARARRARPPEVTMIDDGVATTVDDTDRVLIRQLVHQALATLSRDHYQVLFDVYFRGLSAKETAQRLGIPEGTVKSRVHHALRGLRAALDAS